MKDPDHEFSLLKNAVFAAIAVINCVAALWWVFIALMFRRNFNFGSPVDIFIYAVTWLHPLSAVWSVCSYFRIHARYRTVHILAATGIFVILMCLYSLPSSRHLVH